MKIRLIIFATLITLFSACKSSDPFNEGDYAIPAGAIYFPGGVWNEAAGYVFPVSVSQPDINVTIALNSGAIARIDKMYVRRGRPVIGACAWQAYTGPFPANNEGQFTFTITRAKAKTDAKCTAASVEANGAVGDYYDFRFDYTTTDGISYVSNTNIFARTLQVE